MTVISSIKEGSSNIQPFISDSINLNSLLLITGQPYAGNPSLYGTYKGSLISIEEFLYSIFYLPPPYIINIGFKPYEVQSFVISSYSVIDKKLYLSILKKVTSCGNIDNKELIDIPVEYIYFISDARNNSLYL